MSINLSQRGAFPPELSQTMTGGWVSIGELEHNPVLLIFDNQATVPVAISTNGGTDTWKTFSAGEALVLDLRAQNGVAANFTFDVGVTFHGNGASGVFRISYIYAKG